jgi:hypothetical protein
VTLVEDTTKTRAATPSRSHRERPVNANADLYTCIWASTADATAARRKTIGTTSSLRRGVE